MTTRRQAKALARRIEAALRAHADPVRARGAKAYLKSDWEFIGIRAQVFRRAIKAELAASPPLDRAALLATASDLWSHEVFELRGAAVELLTMHGALLAPADLAFVERLVRESHTWALVDGLAAHVAGSLVERYPTLGRTLDRWARDADFWVRRSAMLALLIPLRRGGGDFERFSRYADAMLDEREFFIRKAIGWVLRDTSKRRPAMVGEWLAPRMHRASGVTLREALKYLDAPPAAKAVRAPAGAARRAVSARSRRRLAR
jgi:3-methyladenine DNA glycosylase AlkD